MNELYWITRFDALHSLFLFMSVSTGIALVIAIMGWAINYDAEYSRERNTLKVCFKVMKCAIFPFVLGILGGAFVPITKEALIIYGVGGTVDYLKENPTAKQLPNKCIEALDKWVDTWNVEDKKEKE